MRSQMFKTRITELLGISHPILAEVWAPAFPTPTTSRLL